MGSVDSVTRLFNECDMCILIEVMGGAAFSGTGVVLVVNCNVGAGAGKMRNGIRKLTFFACTFCFPNTDQVLINNSPLSHGGHTVPY